MFKEQINKILLNKDRFNMENKILYIDINMDDTLSGLDAISFVTHPAVETNFLCFEETPKEMHFSTDEHIITGVALRADKPIYRRYRDYEYYVVFTKDVIKKLVRKYSKMNLFNSVNLQHDDNQSVKDAYMVESYIIDKERGVVPQEFQDIEDGSWIVSYYIDNDELWNQIKESGNFNGFSVQGMFDLVDNYIEEHMSEENAQTFDQWISGLVEE